MNEPPSSQSNNTPNESPNHQQEYVSLYLKLLEDQFYFSARRWTITTFFIGISFAIVGFSSSVFSSNQLYQNNFDILIRYLAAILAYWFGFFLSVSLDRYSKAVRKYLDYLEGNQVRENEINEKKVPFDFESKIKEYMNNEHQRLPTSTKLLRYFGIGYTIMIILRLISFLLFR